MSEKEIIYTDPKGKSYTAEELIVIFEPIRGVIELLTESFVSLGKSVLSLFANFLEGYANKIRESIK